MCVIAECEIMRCVCGYVPFSADWRLTKERDNGGSEARCRVLSFPRAVRSWLPAVSALSLAGAAISIIFVATEVVFYVSIFFFFFFVAAKVRLPRQNFRHDRILFVATSILLSRQKMCFVATKDVFCRDKHVFVVTKLLSRQK